MGSFKAWWDLLRSLYCEFPREYAGKIKIGKYFVKIWTRVWRLTFYGSRCILMHGIHQQIHLADYYELCTDISNYKEKTSISKEQIMRNKTQALRRWLLVLERIGFSGRFALHYCNMTAASQLARDLHWANSRKRLWASSSLNCFDLDLQRLALLEWSGIHAARSTALLQAAQCRAVTAQYCAQCECRLTSVDESLRHTCQFLIDAENAYV